MYGCLSKLLNNLSLSNVFSESLSFKIIDKLLKPAAAITGCPPNVVICPNIGFFWNLFMKDFLVIIAPTGNPPPNAFPSNKISGEIPKCSNANNFPVLPNPV